MTNAFTFVAVPSAIHHAHAKPVYVESTSSYVLCLEDLALKAKTSGAKYLMISHMRGKIADMDEVKRICDENGVVLLEDCAHSIGVRFGDGTKDARHTGHHGVAACISSQSYKMLNSGEGGFYLTDNDVMAAKARRRRKGVKRTYPYSVFCVDILLLFILCIYIYIYIYIVLLLVFKGGGLRRRLRGAQRAPHHRAAEGGLRRPAEPDPELLAADELPHRRGNMI